jgi:phenylalanyl-tRNA synthetase beta chain
VPTEDGDSTHEWWRLGLALTARPTCPPGIDRLDPSTSTTPRALIELIAESLGYERPTFSALTDDPNLHPGRAARVAASDRIFGQGWGRSIPPSSRTSTFAPIGVLGRGDSRSPASRVASHRRRGSPARRVIRSSTRDLAVIVAETTSAAEVEASIRERGGALLRSVTLFDIYRGRPLDDHQKSLAYRLAFAADDRTLGRKRG